MGNLPARAAQRRLFDHQNSVPISTADGPSRAHGTIDTVPPIVRKILRAVRDRFHAQPLTHRPSLDVPESLAGLIYRAEIIALGRAGYWPLSPELLAWVAIDTGVRAHRRRRFRAAVQRAVKRILGKQLGTAAAEGTN